jgi:DNA-binding transcriptional LysR family regulator
LLRRELDVAVIRQAVTGRQLNSVPLTRDHFVIAMPEDHPLAGADGPVELSAYRDDSWVWLPRRISPDYHDELAAACRQAGFTPEAHHYANSIHSQLAMVECGLGVTLVPESSAARQPRALAWRELRKRIDLVELSVVSRAGGEEPLVNHFIACSPRER